jgi:hypothetical protein
MKSSATRVYIAIGTTDKSRAIDSLSQTDVRPLAGFPRVEPPRSLSGTKLKKVLAFSSLW